MSIKMNWKRSENKKRETAKEGRVNAKKRRWGSCRNPVVVDVELRVYEGNLLVVFVQLRGKVVTRMYFCVYGHTPRAVRLFSQFVRCWVKKIEGGPRGTLGTWPS